MAEDDGPVVARGKSLAAAVIAVGLALVASACGGRGATPVKSKTAGRTFALLKIVDFTADYLDPALSYSTVSWQAFQDVYLGLVVKAHVSCQSANCTRILPGLATTTGIVTDGGRDFEFTLRKGLKFSNGRPVEASDFKNTIIRDFRLNSPGVGFFSNIVGIASCEANPTKCSNISGIAVNDKTGTVEIKLVQPESDFLYVLTTPFSAVLPSSTPQKDTENPPPAADGPYYFSSYKPSRSFVMLRNPYWRKGEVTAVPDGNPDKIVAVMTNDPAQAAQYVTSNQYEYDANTLPPDRLRQLLKKYRSQIRLWPTASTYYFFMNQRTRPFNNLKARQAVNYAISRQTLVNLSGGLGVPTWNFLPPMYLQYKRIAPTPYPYSLSHAKQLVQESGTAGMTVGVYTVADNSVFKAEGEYLAGQLSKIGWKTQLHEFAGAQYFTVIGNEATKAQIGFNNWYEDYPYPSDWFGVLQNGEDIRQQHNNDTSNVDVKSVNKEIDRLDHLPAGRAVSSSTTNAWAALDKTLMVKYASEAPFLNSIATSFFSPRMDPNCDVFDDNADDLAQFCLK